MNQTRQTAATTTVNKPLNLSAQAGKTAPVLLTESALKQVVGGVKVIVPNTPQTTW